MPVDPDPGGRLLSKRALAIVLIAIALGGAMQLVAYLLSKDDSINQDTLIRADIVMTLSFYAVVAVLIVSQITPSVRLRWGEGPLLERLAIGAGIGLGLGGLLLALVSAAAGHLYPDQRIVLLMSAGDPTHVILVVALTCLIAPLVEETLFRGLLLEALRPHGLQAAVAISAVLFAVWHFLPASLPYYIAMGVGLGSLYVRKGMASSMAAHACFNGVLTVAAVVVVLGPGHTYHVDGLTLKAPSGWSQQSSDEAAVSSGALLLQGPDGSAVFLSSLESDVPFNADLFEQRLQTTPIPLPSNAQIEQSTVREIPLKNLGEGVEADVSVGPNRGHLIMFAASGRDFVMVFVNGGSTKADSDFTKMLGSLVPG